MPFANKNILTELVAQSNVGFEQVYRSMQHGQKIVAEKVLVYFDKVIDHLLEWGEGANMQCIHIHIPLVEGYFKELILEFVAIKLFYRSLERDNEPGNYIQTRVQELNAVLKRNQIPAGASTKNGGNREYKEWRRQRTELRKEIAFLSAIPDGNKGLFPNVILNTLVQDAGIVNDIYFTTSLDEMPRKAYILHNTERFTSLIKALHSQDIVQRIQDILLFDCTGRTLFNSCTREQLERYKDEDVHIENLIVISFSKNPFRLKQLIDKSTSIYQRHFGLQLNVIPGKGAYIFQERELKMLLKAEMPQRNIKWIKGANVEVKAYWDLIHSLDIPQLRTIYVFNLFMAATTLRITNMIIERLFSGRDDEGLFNEEVHEAIAELTDEEKKELKDVAAILLKKIVDVWETAKVDILRILKYKGSVALIVPLPLLKDAIFDSEMRFFLPGVGFRMYSWKDIKGENIQSKFILSINYKDAGKYPFNIFPNIFEINIATGTQFYCFFLLALFGKRYEQFEREYNTELNKRTRNLFRRKYLGQQDIGALQAPVQDEMRFDDVDYQDSDLGDPVDTIIVTYNDNSHVTLYPSKMLVMQRNEELSFNVVRADELTEDDKGCKIQLLEELHADLNLFQIRPEEEKELERIKLEYSVIDNSKVLWKVLLARKQKEFSNLTIYEHMGGVMGDMKFVRYEYFRDNWLDPQSKLLIPRRRRHFRAICEYLALPPVYYRLKLKKSASEKWRKRDSTQKMNKLLIQMFNEGLFNVGIDWSNVQLKHLLDIHDLEEKNITEDNIVTELRALVELLKENILLRKIQNIDLP